ncbi:MAG: glycoside hydrolase family 127 protein [Woeseiaceae bacterium]|nr:glycoside hydrolase family 127 protein [Woeseiaceae bacterium]
MKAGSLHLATAFAIILATQAHAQGEPLPVGAIKPDGWMLEQMQNDLHTGFVGNLDRLVPEQMLQDDIYGRDRLTRLVEEKDVGAHSTGADWEVQFLWWNSETQSNWWDGYLRNVLLVEDDELIRERLAPYVRDKLATADPDGYIGIYAPDLRYEHTTENGELWAQASLFRGLLAYHEATGDEEVLDAVRDAVDLTMESLPIGESEPFKVTDAFAGVGHGLMIVDVLDTLARITGDDRYLDYAVFLFEDYNAHTLPEADIQIDNLLDPDYRFHGHGVHTYEHLRALVIAAEHTGRGDYREALDAYIEKLDDVLTAAGGPIGDEFVLGRHAHASATGYEYCSLQELLHSYSLLLESTGDARWADRIEWLLYNAAQGARHPDGRSIAYVKTDNAFQAMGHVDMDNPQNEERMKYSPAHRDVAICCVPNAGRIYPYFVQAMYHRTPRGISVNLFGASEASLKLNDSDVLVRQQTDYPFDYVVRIEVEADADFELRVRMPAWATGGEVEGADFTLDNGWISIDKAWEGTSQIEIRFEPIVRIMEHTSGTLAVAHGPLLYALPIAHEEVAGTLYGEPDFHDVYAKPLNPVNNDWQLLRDGRFELVAAEDRIAGPFDSIALKGQLYDESDARMIDVELVPMGGTVLRQVSFCPVVASRENALFRE